ncbi:hypothetical protein [Sessilibacter corallicola]|uniref:Uncharacterized protein n=1 Tax=Sessilibacter corallicola TaxID=2904075 RepID=A0ABQ0AB26_9GAMM|nr:hypothetical protein [Sessilibacter corallicola]MCE2028200.1 hypothetical protein [Sessilibacter corallicola]
MFDLYSKHTAEGLMAVGEKKRKVKKKDSQLIVRINGEEREEFINLCEHLDTSAAREIRHFIRDFIKKHSTDTED